MWTCKHCKNEFEFKTISEKANHSRWCSENPKRNDWDKTAASEKNYGKVRSFTVACNECGSDFTVKEREKLFPQKEQYFCSRNCANAQGGKAKAEKYGIVGDRTIANKHYKQECAVCGEDRVIDVHHIDEDRLNNHPSNLIFLCPNHHALYHRRKDEEVIEVIMGHGTAWGGHFPCKEEISRDRYPGAPPYFYNTN